MIEEIIKMTKEISEEINNPEELNIVIMLLLKYASKKKIIDNNNSLLQRLQEMYPQII
jgi:hypothetical protein